MATFTKALNVVTSIEELLSESRMALLEIFGERVSSTVPQMLWEVDTEINIARHEEKVENVKIDYITSTLETIQSPFSDETSSIGSKRQNRRDNYMNGSVKSCHHLMASFMLFHTESCIDPNMNQMRWIHWSPFISRSGG